MNNQTMQLKKHTQFFALSFYKSNVKTEAYPFGVLNKNVMGGAHSKAIDLTNRCEAVARLFFYRYRYNGIVLCTRQSSY